jgi:hypothetical protein
MVHANIVFKRFLTEWTVTKRISLSEKENIRETIHLTEDGRKVIAFKKTNFILIIN